MEKTLGIEVPKKRSNLAVDDSFRITMQTEEFNKEECGKLSCDIAEWMSSLLEVQIDSDLCTSLADGYLLCKLLHDHIPGGRMKKRFHKHPPPLSAVAADNIHIFAEKCMELGMLRTFVLNQSHFAKQQIKHILSCLLLIAFLGKSRNMDTPLPALNERKVLAQLPGLIHGLDSVAQEQIRASSSTLYPQDVNVTESSNVPDVKPTQDSTQTEVESSELSQHPNQSQKCESMSVSPASNTSHSDQHADDATKSSTLSDITGSVDDDGEVVVVVDNPIGNEPVNEHEAVVEEVVMDVPNEESSIVVDGDDRTACVCPLESSTTCEALPLNATTDESEDCVEDHESILESPVVQPTIASREKSNVPLNSTSRLFGIGVLITLAVVITTHINRCATRTFHEPLFLRRK